MKSIFLRVSLDEALPTQAGNYLVTLQRPNGITTVKKIFFLDGRFRLKDGNRHCRILNWFKRIDVDKDYFDRLLANTL